MQGCPDAVDHSFVAAVAPDLVTARECRVDIHRAEDEASHREDEQVGHVPPGAALPRVAKCLSERLRELTAAAANVVMGNDHEPRACDRGVVTRRLEHGERGSRRRNRVFDPARGAGREVDVQLFDLGARPQHGIVETGCLRRRKLHDALRAPELTSLEKHRHQVEADFDAVVVDRKRQRERPLEQGLCRRRVASATRRPAEADERGERATGELIVRDPDLALGFVGLLEVPRDELLGLALRLDGCGRLEPVGKSLVQLSRAAPSATTRTRRRG